MGIVTKMTEEAGRVRRALVRPAMIPAVIALVVFIACAFYADWQNNVVNEQRLRGEVATKVSLIRAKLEGNINGNIQLLRGLVAMFEADPVEAQKRFDKLAQQLFEEDSQLRSIAVAPGLVVNAVYPMAGNEAAMGLDYVTNERQREAALRARDSGKMILAGPVELVQGGVGFVARFPVSVPDMQGEPRFWGLIAAVIDVGRLFADSGLTDADLGLDIGLYGKDGLGLKGEQFFGRAGLLQQQPVTSEVTLPTGTWQIAAIPSGGWVARLPDSTVFRLLILLAGILLVAPISIAGRLLDERQLHLSELDAHKSELEKLSRRLSLALETSKVGVWEYDLETRDLVWDARVNEIFGLPQDGGKRDYSHWLNALHPDDADRARQEFRTAVDVTGSYHSDYRVVMPNGQVRHVRAIGSVYDDPDSTPKIVGVNWDVTSDVMLNEDLKRAKLLTEARNLELEGAKARIEHDSLHDSLTGLPNRRYLDEELGRRAAICAAEGGSIALLHIDLDRFKEINDTLGHAAGDAMLVHAADVLRSNVRDSDFVARIGGDEFVILSSADRGPRMLSNLALRIIRRMRRPVKYDGHECRFGVSVGIAWQRDGFEAESRLLVDADIALYRAKSRGRNRYEFFTEELQAEIVKTKRIADEILTGLEQKQFVAYYQPQFHARTHRVIGVEALVRWLHPTRGVLTPDVFLPIAEDLSVMGAIDRMILEQTLQDFAGWREAGLGVPHVSVNVSAERLREDDLLRSLKGLEIEPGTLSFELVESIYLDDDDPLVAWNTDQIKELGIDIEIDDFGTGYASIVSLLKLKPKRLKIDRQLVMPIVQSSAQQHLIASIIEIGHSLGIEVVAEGVETPEHAALLRDLGCDILQGYAFSRAISGEAFRTFLASQNLRAVS